MKGLRKFYSLVNRKQIDWRSDVLIDTSKSSQLIYDALNDNNPVMIGRYGGYEIMAVITYLSIISNNHSVKDFIKGVQYNWWWEKNLMYYMENNTGFFPADEKHLMEYGNLMINDLRESDILGFTEITWSYSKYLDSLLANKIKLSLWSLEPWFSDDPWTRVLEGKRVLVVHPLVELMERQYLSNRTRIFSNNHILPNFASLRTVKAVQSLGGISDSYNDWFDALKWMENEIDKEDFDIALIGCGAYGFSLAAHVKRIGKKAVHLGGALQLLFGIKGSRWEDPSFGVKEWGIPVGAYSNLMNEYWVRPDESSKPKNAQAVEGACYW